MPVTLNGPAMLNAPVPPKVPPLSSTVGVVIVSAVAFALVTPPEIRKVPPPLKFEPLSSVRVPAEKLSVLPKTML